MRSSRLPCFKVRDSEGAVEPSRIDITQRGGRAPCLLVFFARHVNAASAERINPRSYVKAHSQLLITAICAAALLFTGTPVAQEASRRSQTAATGNDEGMTKHECNVLALARAHARAHARNRTSEV